MWGKGSNAGVGGGPKAGAGAAGAASSAPRDVKADDQFIGYTYKRKKDVVRSTLSGGIFAFGGPGDPGAAATSSGAGGAAGEAGGATGVPVGMPARPFPGKVPRAGSGHHAVTNGA